MITTCRAAGIVSAAALAIGLGMHFATTIRVAVGPGPPIFRPGRGFDEPDEAAAYAAMKRRGPGADHDAVRAYDLARARMRTMAVYSTRIGSTIARKPLQPERRSKGFVRPRALSEWTPVGPGNIGGRTRTLVIHPENHEVMYAGGVSGGVWKTVDGGQWWRPIADDLANIAVNSMAMHPEHPDTLFVGTGEGHFREIVRGTWLPLRGAGIFRTDDGGDSWSRLPSTDGEDFHWVNDLVISPRNPDRLWAATRTGVHTSTDGGATWQHSLQPNVTGGCLDLALRTDLAVDWVFASCGTFEQATIYRLKTTSSGEWEPVLTQPEMGRTSLAIAPSDQRVIYALSASNEPGPGNHYEQALHAVYRSTAGGNPGSWRVRTDNTDPEKLNTLLLTNPAGASNVECGWGDENSWTPMGWYCNVIAVDPIDPEVVWAGGVDLFRSNDGGRNWGLASYWWRESLDQTPPPSWAHADQHAIVFHPDYDGRTNTTLFAANDGGIFRTDNPNDHIGTDETAICDPERSQVAFSRLNHNLGITQFYHGATFPGAEAYLGGTQDNGTILGTDGWGRDGWTPIAGGDGGYVAIDPRDADVLYAESQRFGFRKSVDGGRTFEFAVEGITESRWDFLFVTPFTMDPNNPDVLWTGGRTLWRTADGARLWVSASRSPLGTGQVSALAVEPGDSNSVLVGTTSGFIHRTREALTADGSSAWESSRPREGFVTSLAFDPSSPGVVYATYADFGGHHVWRSTDTGVTWEAIDGAGWGALPDIPVHCAVVDPDQARRIYLGTDLGVFTSINGGATWAIENTGFATAVTEWLALASGVAGEPVLFAFTHGRGAWKVALRPTPPEPLRPSGRRRP